MIRVAGIDPGLAHTGWGVIEGSPNRVSHVAHGTINTDAGEVPARRLLKIYEALREVLSVHAPQLVGIETLYFARNRGSALPVAEARGAILLAAAQSGAECVSYTPLEIKQALTGSGRAEKEQVQEMVRIMLGLREIPNPDHAADALAAAICAFHMYQFSNALEGGAG